MNIQQLEYILAVDTYRHFAKAAEHCRVTQPTLSMMIQKLEDELGIKLFDRNTQPVCPTPAGRKVIDQARTVLYQASLIKDIVNEEEQSLKGTFRLAVLPTIAPYLLPRFFQQLSEKHPELDIRILEMKTAPTMSAILNGEIDAAIIANQPTENQLQGDTLYYEQFFGYVAKNDPVFKKDLIRTADISDEHLWLLDEGHCFRDQLMRFCQMEKVKLRQAAYRLEAWRHSCEWWKAAMESLLFRNWRHCSLAKTKKHWFVLSRSPNRHAKLSGSPVRTLSAIRLPAC